jgi:hypothetical protein
MLPKQTITITNTGSPAADYALNVLVLNNHGVLLRSEQVQEGATLVAEVEPGQEIRLATLANTAAPTPAPPPPVNQATQWSAVAGYQLSPDKGTALLTFNQALAADRSAFGSSVYWEVEYENNGLDLIYPVATVLSSPGNSSGVIDNMGQSYFFVPQGNAAYYLDGQGNATPIANHLAIDGSPTYTYRFWADTVNQTVKVGDANGFGPPLAYQGNPSSGPTPTATAGSGTNCTATLRTTEARFKYAMPLGAVEFDLASIPL